VVFLYSIGGGTKATIKLYSKRNRVRSTRHFFATTTWRRPRSSRRSMILSQRSCRNTSLETRRRLDRKRDRWTFLRLAPASSSFVARR